MRIYICGAYPRRDTFRERASQLRAIGHEITSSWLEETWDPNTPLTALDRAQRTEIAMQDMAEVIESDALLAFTEPADTPYTRGGRHWELGVATCCAVHQGWGKDVLNGYRVFIVGPREHIGHDLPLVEHYETFYDFVKFGLRATRNEIDRVFEDGNHAV